MFALPGSVVARMPTGFWPNPSWNCAPTSKVMDGAFGTPTLRTTMLSMTGVKFVMSEQGSTLPASQSLNIS